MASKFMQFILPKNQTFFKLFDQSCANNLQMAQLLYNLIEGKLEGDDNLQLNQISRLKQTGNEIKHKVYLSSAKALVSPFARNDMYALASAIDNICDYLYICSRRFSLFQSEPATPAIKELSGIIIETCIELQKAVGGLSDLDESDAIVSNCNKIKELEDYADKVYGKAISDIMAIEKNAIEVIKYSEILSALERTTDKCEHATLVIESIIIKNK